MNELEKMSLCLTGTVLKSRLTEEVKINKNSKKSSRYTVETLYNIGMSMMTQKWNMYVNWFVLRIDTLCIVSKIGLQLMKVVCDFVEAKDALFRYLGLSLLVNIMTVWGWGVISKTWGDYISTWRLWDCIGGGWSWFFIYFTLELLMSWYFTISS